VPRQKSFFHLLPARAALSRGRATNNKLVSF